MFAHSGSAPPRTVVVVAERRNRGQPAARNLSIDRGHMIAPASVADQIAGEDDDVGPQLRDAAKGVERYSSSRRGRRECRSGAPAFGRPAPPAAAESGEACERPPTSPARFERAVTARGAEPAHAPRVRRNNRRLIMPHPSPRDLPADARRLVPIQARCGLHQDEQCNHCADRDGQAGQPFEKECVAEGDQVHLSAPPPPARGAAARR